MSRVNHRRPTPKSIRAPLPRQRPSIEGSDRYIPPRKAKYRPDYRDYADHDDFDELDE